MSDYPVIDLNTPVEVQAPVIVSTFEVLHVAEDPAAGLVNAFINTGVDSVWISVMDGSNYNPEWSDQDVIDAVKAYAAENWRAAQ